MPTKTFAVEGLTCIYYAARVQAAVSQVEGVSDSQVDYATGTLTVSLAMPNLPTEEIAGAARAAGYTLASEDHRCREGGAVLSFARLISRKRFRCIEPAAGMEPSPAD
ncbi:MAG: heavy-metal-associated domain-containing protein [Chloroflexi bacterium]|nr:heavy-metal-associated domain-containing protein [Chloroflexota bacterium]